MIRRKILVLDSSETIRNVCRNLLTQQGYEPVVHSKGEDALAEFRTNNIDLAVVATDTEGMSGHQVVAELRKEKGGKRLPVLMLIGSAELVDTNELFDVDPDMTLNKPFSPQEFELKVDQLLNRPTDVEVSRQDDDLDIEQILADESHGIDQKLDEDADRAFLGLLSGEESGDVPSDRPQLDRVDLTEELARGDRATEDDFQSDEAPHDYAWFVKEMGTGESPRPRRTPHPAPSAEEAAFQVKEIGTSRLFVSRDAGAKTEADADEDRIFLERPEGSSSSAAQIKEMPSAPAPADDLTREFVKQLAEALAREIVSQIDFDKVVEKLTQLTSESVEQ